MRRRFAFRRLSPEKPPVRGLLSRWLRARGLPDTGPTVHTVRRCPVTLTAHAPHLDEPPARLLARIAHPRREDGGHHTPSGPSGG